MHATVEGNVRPAVGTRLTPEQQQLVAENRGLAGMAAALFTGTEIDFEERVAIGFQGLCRAAQLFDPMRGWKFSTYATVSARREISRELKRLGRAKNVAFRSTLRDPQTLAEIVAAPVDDPDEKIDGDSQMALLEAAIEQLEQRQRLVIRQRLERRSLETIGLALGITKERVRQIEGKARRALRLIMEGGEA